MISKATRFIFLCIVFFNLSFPHAQAQRVLYEANERFHPVVARHAMVAAQNALAARAGRDILRQGGNAIDAAVAVGYALSVVLPRGGGLGGGGFMLIWLNEKKQAIAINYRETASRHATPDMYLNAQANVDRDKLNQSVLAAGVPGQVAGLNLALKRYGTLPLRQVLKPAIHLAEHGFTVTPAFANAIHLNRERLMKFVSTRQIFFKPDLTEYQVGDRFRQPDLAKSLRLIAKHGTKAFYHGQLTKRITDNIQAEHGLLDFKDFANYQAKVVKPLSSEYSGYRLYAMPPPSSGGVTVIEILNILETLLDKSQGINSAKTIHLLTEAMNLAYHDRNQLLGDPDFVTVPSQKLLSNEHAKQLRQQINSKQHTPAAKIDTQFSAPDESPETTHFSVMDQHGNLVANTHSLNYSYGSGYVVPGTGILLNNHMDDFTAKPGVANAFGLVQGEKNAIAPGKRPLSSMAPILVVDKNLNPVLATGTPGGSRIITTMVQFLLNVFLYDLNIATATCMPRMHSQLWPDTVFVEQGMSLDTIRLLEAMGHQVTQVPAMGSIQTVMMSKQHVLGYSDPRRSGSLAVGY